MNHKKTIVIIGKVAPARQVIINNPKYAELFYSKSIVNDEELIKSSTEPYYQFLLREQLEKDKKILENDLANRTLIIEEWHLGNIAWIETVNKDDAQKYEMSVQEQINKLSNDLTIWYVSTDIQKYLGKDEEKYKLYLDGLSRVFKKYGLACENLDGDVNFELLDKRISYLLNES